ncbi:hypothetical protein AMTR_s00049p00207980 [Amborella trichopoda]|uniref:Uncharacterized protein n=1 Tax=Amborella trichopoda TaxID=13333 RepID=W1Q099_AMBTC|nr:hypothetical protein AMTR_s00049p00207980 [Amborella trichopoda]
MKVEDDLVELLHLMGRGEGIQILLVEEEYLESGVRRVRLSKASIIEEGQVAMLEAIEEEIIPNFQSLIKPNSVTTYTRRSMKGEYIERKRILAWSLSTTDPARPLDTSNLPAFSQADFSSTRSTALIEGITFVCVIVFVHVAIRIIHQLFFGEGVQQWMRRQRSQRGSIGHTGSPMTTYTRRQMGSQRRDFWVQEVSAKGTKECYPYQEMRSWLSAYHKPLSRGGKSYWPRSGAWGPEASPVMGVVPMCQPISSSL